VHNNILYSLHNPTHHLPSNNTDYDCLMTTQRCKTCPLAHTTLDTLWKSSTLSIVKTATM